MLAELSAPLLILLFVAVLAIPLALGLTIGLWLRRRIKQARASKGSAKPTGSLAGKFVAMENAYKTGSVGQKLSPNLQVRLMGALFFLGSIFIVWVGIIEPIQSASRHLPEFTWWPKATVLAPFFFLIGVLYLCMGEKGYHILGLPVLRTVRSSGQNRSTLGIVLEIIAAVLGIALYFWLTATLRSYGYAA